MPGEPCASGHEFDPSREAKSFLSCSLLRNRFRVSSFGRVLGVGLFLAPFPVLLAGCRHVSQATPGEVPSPSASSTAFPLTLIDAKGHRWTFAKPADRIVSLAPSVTELLFALGAGSHVVGVTGYCDYPPAAKTREKVGGFKDPSVEKVVALNPDVVIASRGTPDPIIDNLITAGQKVFAVDHDRIHRLFASLTVLGKIAGCPESAEALRRQLTHRWEAVVTKTSRLPLDRRPRLLYVVWDDPLFTAGPGSYADELITAAGAVNIAADADSSWPQYSLEAAIAKDPQVLLFTAGPMCGFEVVRSKKLAQLRRDKRWRNVSAVKAGRVIVLDEDHLGVPGPRLVTGLEELAHALHPDLFPPGGTTP